MQEKFKIAEFNLQGTLRLLSFEFETYPDAVSHIEKLPAGVYQVQKVFIKN